MELDMPKEFVEIHDALPPPMPDIVSNRLYRIMLAEVIWLVARETYWQYVKLSDISSHAGKAMKLVALSHGVRLGYIKEDTVAGKTVWKPTGKIK